MKNRVSEREREKQYQNRDCLHRKKWCNHLIMYYIFNVGSQSHAKNNDKRQIKQQQTIRKDSIHDFCRCFLASF